MVIEVLYCMPEYHHLSFFRALLCLRTILRASSVFSEDSHARASSSDHHLIFPSTRMLGHHPPTIIQFSQALTSPSTILRFCSGTILRPSSNFPKYSHTRASSPHYHPIFPSTHMSYLSIIHRPSSNFLEHSHARAPSFDHHPIFPSTCMPEHHPPTIIQFSRALACPSIILRPPSDFSKHSHAQVVGWNSL